MFDTICLPDSVTLSLLTGLTILLILYYCLKPTQNYPPGPSGLPIIGSLFQIVTAATQDRTPFYIDTLLEKFGSIISFKVGVIRLVYLSDPLDVKELFSRDVLDARPHNLTMLRLLFPDGEPTGIGMNNGPSHKEMRRFALLSLRDFGVGKQSLDQQIQLEAEAFSQYLDSLVNVGGVTENIKPKVQMCIHNVIHSIMFGHRYDYWDPRLPALLQKLANFFKLNVFAAPENFLPFIQYIPFINSKATRFAKFYESQNDSVAYVAEQIEEHRQTFDSTQCRDFIDLYLKNESEGLSIEHHELYNQETLYFVILDLFRAGTDTTASGMGWSILYLMKYPDVQTQLQHEIDREIGESPFKRTDKEKLVKCGAFIKEMLRKASIAYQGVPHMAKQDISYKNYVIPAGSVVFAAIRSIHHDKQYWKDPEEFRLDRWYDDKTGKFINHEPYFIPFSSGKRACIGKQLALIELIIFLVTILQKFSFHSVGPADQIDDSPNFGIVASPKTCKFRISRRT